MAQVTSGDVLAALKRIAAHDGRGNIVSRDLVSDIAIDGATVMFALQTSAADAKAMEPVRAAAEKAALAIPGVAKAIWR